MLTRAGVRPQFPKVRSYLKLYKRALEKWEEEDLPRLKRYAEQGTFEFRYSPDFEAHSYGMSNAEGDLGRVANALRWQAIQGALHGEDGWMDAWVRSTAYAYWAARFEIRNQRRILDDYRSGNRPQYLGFVAFHHYLFALANCLILGWTNSATDLARGAIWGLNHSGFIDGTDEKHRRIQHFVLRLVSSNQGWPDRSSPACAYDEPVYNLLIQQWRDPAPGILIEPLLAACDRHTHEARVDSNKSSYDLPWLDEWYVPFEVLAVLKLREQHGLSNPELDHPLMKTPLGRLPTPVPFYKDELLDGVVARARQEFPDL